MSKFAHVKRALVHINIEHEAPHHCLPCESLALCSNDLLILNIMVYGTKSRIILFTGIHLQRAFVTITITTLQGPLAKHQTLQ
jgi:hypothetical protein